MYTLKYSKLSYLRHSKLLFVTSNNSLLRGKDLKLLLSNFDFLRMILIPFQTSTDGKLVVKNLRRQLQSNATVRRLYVAFVSEKAAAT